MGLQDISARALSNVFKPPSAPGIEAVASRLEGDSSHMALDTSTLSGLHRQAVSKIFGFNHDLLQKYPERLQLKYKNMALSPRRFMTGQPELYTYDMRAMLNAPGLETPLQGDLHLNNFGTMQRANGKIQVRLNDFDMASFGPPIFDTQRMATHIQLAAQESKLSPAQANQLVETFASSYRGTLKQLAEGAKKPGLAPPKILKHVLKDKKKADPKAWLDHQAPEVSGKRQLVRNASAQSVSAETFKDLGTAFASYRAGLTPAAAHDLAAYTLKDATSLLGGTGSMGVGRYKLLLEAPHGRSPVILTLKEQGAPAIERYRAPRWPYASEAERNVALSNLMDKGLSAFRGSTTLPLRDGFNSTSYLVERAYPGDAFENIGEVKKYSDFKALVAYYGSQTAIAHASGQSIGKASAADILKSLPGNKTHAKRLVSFSKAYAAQVTKDYEAFTQALKSDPLLKNQA